MALAVPHPSEPAPEFCGASVGWHTGPRQDDPDLRRPGIWRYLAIRALPAAAARAVAGRPGHRRMPGAAHSASATPGQRADRVRRLRELDTARARFARPALQSAAGL